MEAIPLGPFELHTRLGAGAFGGVWGARHVATGREVAVKVLHGADSVASRHTFQLEIGALAALDHPGIVRLLDAGVVDAAAADACEELTPGTPWVALERIHGGTLHPWCGRLGWERCRAILVGLLDALAHAHARGLVHLDVKPANVLLHHGDPRLADFGLARAWERASGGRIGGTPPYMAPELFRRAEAEIGPPTDLYALGCLAQELVSGAPPFDLSTVEELRTAHLHRPPPPPEPAMAVPEGLAAWIARLLAKPPRQRFRFAADAARALMRLGSAVGSASGAVASRPDEAETVVLPRDDAEPWTPSQTRALLAPTPEVVVPVDWRRGEGGPRPWLDDSNPALLRLRRTLEVGQVRERGLLWAALRQVAATGRPSAVGIGGPDGSGRSHLARWLCERAHEVGAASFVRVDLEEEELDPPALWAALETDRPVVLHLRHPHLAPAAADFGQDVLAARLPVLLVLSGPSLPEALEDHPSTVAMTPSPLTQAEAIDALRSRIGLRPEVAGRIADACGNNPGRALRLLDELASDGALRTGPAGVTLAPGTPLRVSDHPDHVARLARALEERTEPERRALRVAAALGRVCTAETWARAVAALGEDDPGAALSTLGVAGLLVPLVSGGLALADPTLEPLLDAGPDEAQRVAGACADALAADEDADGLLLGELLVRAGRSAEAVDPLVAGGHAAAGIRSIVAMQRAAELGERALAAAGAPASDPRWGHFAWLTLFAASGGWDAATGHAQAEALLARAETYGWKHARRAALVARARALEELGELDASAADLQAALDVSVELGEAELTAQCHLRIVRLAEIRGARAVALQHVRAGLACVAEGRVRAELLVHLGLLAVQEGRLDDADAAIAEAAATAPTAHSVASNRLALQATVARQRGDLVAAEAALVRSLAHVQASGSPTAGALFNLGMARLDLGRDAEALAIADRLLGGGGAPNVPVRSAACALRLAALAADGSDTDFTDAVEAVRAGVVAHPTVMRHLLDGAAARARPDRRAVLGSLAEEWQEEQDQGGASRKGR